MAETAAILSPDKTVLLPAREAGCPMAEMVTVEELEKKKREYPEAACVCYVNSSAAVKAASDICCTSSNAVEIVEKLPEEQIIFVPDQNLGHYVAQKTQKEIIQWPGYCITHHRVLARHVREVREHYPDAPILVHPECRPEVVELADFVGSTAQILQEGRRSTAEVLIIGTEMGLLHRLKQENPEKTFYLLDQGLICRNMKFTTLEHIADALEGMQYEITVDEEVRVKARDALDKMLNLS